jgi:hypothetical protein
MLRVTIRKNLVMRSMTFWRCVNNWRSMTNWFVVRLPWIDGGLG